MRIFQNGRDISAEVSSTFHYYRAGQMQPSHDAGETRYKAYETTFVALERTADGALKIPANMGCTIYIPGERSGLTAEFVFTAPQQIAVDVLGSQTFTFHQLGDSGRIAALVSQMGALRQPSREIPAADPSRGRLCVAPLPADAGQRLLEPRRQC